MAAVASIISSNRTTLYTDLLSFSDIYILLIPVGHKCLFSLFYFHNLITHPASKSYFSNILLQKTLTTRQIAPNHHSFRYILLIEPSLAVVPIRNDRAYSARRVPCLSAPYLPPYS